MFRFFKKGIAVFICLLFFASLTMALPTKDKGCLNWDGPALNEDGSVLNDLAGFKAYWANTPLVDANNHGYTNGDSWDVPDPLATSACFKDMTNLVVADNKYFVITAYDTSGNESTFSNEVQKVPFAGTVPSAPGNNRLNIK